MHAMRSWLTAPALMLVAQQLHAGNFTVICSASTGGIAFGVYSQLNAANTTSTGSLLVSCTGTGNGAARVSPTVTLSTGFSGSFASRQMLSNSNALNYNIYSSTAYAQILGDGTGGSIATSLGPFTVNGSQPQSASVTLYGLIPAAQDVPPGSYLDAVMVTVTY